MNHLDRIERELEFHNKRYSQASTDAYSWSRRDAMAAKDTYRTPLCYEETQHIIAADYMSAHLNDVAGKRVLVLGGGMDSAAIWFASRGARTTVIDISNVAIAEQKELAEFVGVQFEAKVADAHATGFANESFDIIFGRAILHHLETGDVAKELSRLLAPGGQAIFRDVMKGGWFLSLFRLLTPGVRTPDEHPLTEDDLSIYRSYFAKSDSLYYCYLALPYLAFFKIWDMGAKRLFGPNKWKNVRLKANWNWVGWMDRLEGRLFRAVPFMKRRAWLCVLVLKN